jgi:dTDP-4-amino-4,6-dideoxygalactose transaminase
MASVGFGEWLAVGRAIASKNLLRYGGSFTERFEQRFANYLHAKHVLTTQGGTGALIAALAAAGVGPGDEVIVPAYTWMATAAAPVMVGAVPVMADINESLTLDPADFERKITPFTKAVIPVHMVNAPADMDAIMKIAKKHRIIVIEDACQSVGVPYKNRFTAAIGDMGAFSFNQYKNINVGEGGAVVTSDDRLFARARNYHDLGSYVRNHEETFNEPTFVGTNMRVTEIDGAMLGVQLSKLFPMLARMQKRRAAVAPLFEGKRGFRASPHNSVENACTLTVLFDRVEDAKRFSKETGAFRLQDNSKHVYTNWEPILSQRAFHPKMSPWAWAQRKIEYTPDMCARTLDILERTCRIDLGGRAPTFLLKKRWASKIAAFVGSDAKMAASVSVGAAASA